MAEPTLADILARLDKLEQRIAELAGHEHDHHHAHDEHDHAHEHADEHDHDHEHRHHGHHGHHEHGRHEHGRHEHGRDCRHDHLGGCPCGFDERRVVDLIVDLVEQRMRRVLASGPGGPPGWHGPGHFHGGRGGCGHCGR